MSEKKRRDLDVASLELVGVAAVHHNEAGHSLLEVS